MKGKSYASRLGALALALTLATTSLIGGTLAKYATEVTGDGSATVAAWSFKANEQSKTFTVNLADTSVKEDKLASGMIAPGTQGSFDIVIDATGSDVALKYTIEFSAVTNKPDNLKFYSDGGFNNVLADLQAAGVSDSIAANDATKKRTKTVYWKWDYQSTGNADDVDKADIAATEKKDMTFTITVTGTQQDPTKA